MSDRQRNMILTLIRQKQLSTDAVESLLVSMFGHNDGSMLSKSEASRFIDRLLA